MNREIEFRGKNSANEWLYGYLTKQVGNDCYIIEGNDYLGGVIEETIGQYTGLKDKNGIKIYEGDVVGVKRTYCNSGESEFALYSVVWKKSWCSWALDRVDVGMIQSCRLEPMETYEIIGNIYDTILKIPK